MNTKWLLQNQKNSDLSFVKILSEVVKKLLDTNISGEGWKKMTAKNIVDCKTCGKFYSSERYMKSHVTKVHGEGKDVEHVPNTCTICAKSFSTEIMLKSHSVL